MVRPLDIAAVIPAAGASRRMGRPKLLLPWRGPGSTVLGATLGALAAGGASPRVVVLAPDRPETAALAALVGANGAAVAWNPRPEDGMLSTIRAGLACLDASDLAGVLVAPADLPDLRPDTVAAVVAALRSGASLAVARFDGRRGHPLGIAASLLPEVARLDPAIGLRQLVVDAGDRVLWVDVDDPGAVHDVDLPTDLPPGR